MGEPADNVVNEFIIGQSFDENPGSSRNKEFCIDNAEYTEIKPRNIKRKILVVALSLVGIVGAGAIAGIQGGYIGKSQKTEQSPFPVVQATQGPADTVSLPASLQALSPSHDGASSVEQSPVAAPPDGTVNSLPQATPPSLANNTPFGQPGANLSSSLTAAAAEPAKALPHAAVSEKQLPASPVITASSVSSPTVTATAKVEDKSPVVRPVASKPVVATIAKQQSNPVVPEPASAAAVKQPPPPTQSKQSVIQNANAPILANTPEHAEGSVKPLNIVSADRIGLRGLSKNSIQLQRGANLATFSVGDSLPNGETIKYIDDKTMTIVTDKQVMRITN